MLCPSVEAWRSKRSQQWAKTASVSMHPVQRVHGVGSKMEFVLQRLTVSLNTSPDEYQTHRDNHLSASYDALPRHRLCQTFFLAEAAEQNLGYIKHAALERNEDKTLVESCRYSQDLHRGTKFPNSNGGDTQ